MLAVLTHYFGSHCLLHVMIYLKHHQHLNLIHGKASYWHSLSCNVITVSVLNNQVCVI